MENSNLLQYLRSFPHIPRIPLLHDIISGVQYLHRLNIIHGDLRAMNIFISGTGRAILASFGLARILTTKWTPVITRDLKGALHWRAPELVFNEKQPLQKKNDVWSFGCTCYEVNKFNLLALT
ncbi:Mitogen-activated protein kinase kinase kinase YODA [Leucoagaricus sp. SymC.cos]|nr:Mitogen-activated protein kinase kinase kinase YODA [Leucoagaricus sp. SymC.cos]